MSNSDLALSIVLGVGLAAATGFRVFLPMLVASVAAYSGSLPLGDGFAWLGTPAAMLMLGVAALLEVGAYFIPGVDNLLDVIAAPVAVIAGAGPAICANCCAIDRVISSRVTLPS